jgi:energy-coupling factor transport system permease protein
MSGLDSRVWILWGAAAMLPLLTGRHPLVIAEIIAVALIVRAVCVPPSRAMAWGWLARLSALAVPIGIVFNMLTVRAGDQVVASVPGDVPLLSGDLTWNAVVYGALSGLSVVALVLTGTTVAAGMDWSDLMRTLPPRAASLAVAGSVAWSFLPRLATSWREIREAQTARGHSWSGPRDAVPLVVPLLAGGLDRSIQMAEALEARGFGSLATARSSRRGSIALGISATAVMTGLYLFAVGRTGLAALITAPGVALAAIALLTGRDAGAARITRYRERRWTPADTWVVAAMILAIAATVVTLSVAPEALRYDPYPRLTWPVSSVWLLLGLALLLVPAFVAPTAPDREARS